MERLTHDDRDPDWANHLGAFGHCRLGATETNRDDGYTASAGNVRRSVEELGEYWTALTGPFRKHHQWFPAGDHGECSLERLAIG
jgi:hypothetical protein